MNIKIDEDLVPEQDEPNEYIAPQTSRERELCNLLEQVLGLPKVGVTDDFFDLGGTSIQAIRLSRQARSIGLEASIKVFLEGRTVEGIVSLLSRTSSPKIEYNTPLFV
mmetsp:Transcript_4539/g.6757  ORF Transcript_4539/g.6757 Transcript_4539/m.6757 type:complete len:108 (-) Transcript_4539:485-808(-)|eukprot:CAMPEP_0203773528 /NCGR_PEP_ID=MMETSP0099_2-20121227/4710_1 /ASSEMBLY_ACC=CAM_ASM_000209 /TAXON_ID=96639 /ORGANISM=" , Strain NY0313808BC1" /LENGTH=107 /DNA_ID=CAMNT_0050671373 /DNA_START=40 /DNA_END=363 /DNA_ORIENTATION=+